MQVYGTVTLSPKALNQVGVAIRKARRPIEINVLGARHENP